MIAHPRRSFVRDTRQIAPDAVAERRTPAVAGVGTRIVR